MTPVDQLRNWVFCLLAILLVAVALVYGEIVTAFDAEGVARVWIYFLLGLSGFALVFCWPRLTPKREVALLLLLGAVVRLALLPTAPSDDIHRYLWEGKLVADGVSPYAATADDPIFAAYFDDQWERMNHRDKWTAYPPGSELVFALLAKISYSTTAFKLAFIGLDLVVVALVAGLLHFRSLPLRWAGFYAFNPIVLISFAGEGHFDVLMIAPMVAAVLASEHKRYWLAFVLLGIAVQMKIFALLALPFLIRECGWKYLGAFILTVVVISIPFAADIGNMVNGLFLFGSGRSFNGFVYDTWLRWFDSRTVANIITAVLFLGLCAWRYFSKARSHWEGDWYFVIGALLILSPTVHFWYLTWLLPFVALRPSIAWLCFSLTMGVYFLVWSNAESGAWGLTRFESGLIWVPFLALGIYEWTHFHRKKVERRRDFPEGLSVIIPTFNAADHLPDCLQSVEASSTPAEEIIVADGGSTDNTLNVASRNECQVVTSPLGRGEQIAAGLEQAKYRYVLILHADCVLGTHAIKRLHRLLKDSPFVVGGSLGQRFNRASPMLLFIEVLNEIRATVGSVSFGDQAQFFDRRYLSNEAYPAQPLMEDVELSLRLRERGQCAYLGEELVSESAKWQRVGSWQRIALVFRFVAVYRWTRIWFPGKVGELSRRLYREYYGQS